MKPINENNSGCDPISSKCVIWQGPDIECLNLCKGDSVSDVVYKMADELCNILDVLNIDSYDLSCLELNECGPENYVELMQLLIGKICDINNIDSGSSSPDSSDVLQTEVPVCEEFYWENPQGDTMTHMTIQNYVLAIGNKVCSLIGQ